MPLVWFSSCRTVIGSNCLREQPGQVVLDRRVQVDLPLAPPAAARPPPSPPSSSNRPGTARPGRRRARSPDRARPRCRARCRRCLPTRTSAASRRRPGARRAPRAVPRRPVPAGVSARWRRRRRWTRRTRARPTAPRARARTREAARTVVRRRGRIGCSRDLRWLSVISLGRHGRTRIVGEEGAGPWRTPSNCLTEQGSCRGPPLGVPRGAEKLLSAQPSLRLRTVIPDIANSPGLPERVRAEDH